ncbi:MAG: hypothetical protein HYZ43_05000 [Flavobacteriia bacterium]|nr:hypothetical protein [Flavobacteriia bacterium]
MPIEIKELLIRINVDENSPKGSVPPPVDQTQLVQESVDQVLEVIKQQKER